MHLRKTYNINQLRDYASLFSRREVSRWYKNDLTALRQKVDRYDPMLLGKNCSYVAYLRSIYRILEQYYPNEYIYKNEFIDKWLVKELGLEDSIIINEFRLGKAVADLVMFNGISRVFEIKTLFDKEVRLDNQLKQYCKIFNEVYIVVPEVKKCLYLKQNSSAGIISFDHINRHFTLIRPAKYMNDIDVDALMEILHTREYIKVVEFYFGKITELNDFNKFNVCKSLIKQIPRDELNRQFISLMKERKIHNEFSKRERQFNQLFLSMNYTIEQKRQLLSNLSSIIS